MTQHLELSNPDMAEWHKQTQATDLPAPTLGELLDLLEHASKKRDGRYQRGNLPRFLQVHNHYIQPGRWQPRKAFDEAALQELADDVQRRGIINPLKVFVNEKELFELIAGERRLRAARLAGLGLVPIEIVEGTPEEIHEMSIIDNLQREGLSPLEEGEAYQQMFQQLGVSEAELARRVGKSRGHVQQRRALAAAAPQVREALEAGEINLTLARNIAMGTDSQKLQKKALAALKKRLGTGARTEEKHVREIVSDIVRKETQEKLKTLGWIVLDGYIWGGSERPRHWEAAEMTQAVNEQRRPTGDLPAPGELTEEQKHIIKARYFEYYKDEKFQPWLVFTDRHTYRPAFFSYAEIPDLVLDIGREFAELRQQFEKHGYELLMSEAGSLEAKHPRGHTRHSLSLKDLEAFLADLEAGKIDPAKEAQPQGFQWVCQHCAKRLHSRTSTPQRFGHFQLCQNCYDVAKQRIAELREEIKQEHGMLIVRMDAPLLRRMLFRFHSSTTGDAIWNVKGYGHTAQHQWEKLQQADEEQLREVLLDCLTEDEYGRRATDDKSTRGSAHAVSGS
jgi:ParB/RepB/Spo0J family partition protein